VESWCTRAAGRPALFPPRIISRLGESRARACGRRPRMGTTHVRTHAPTTDSTTTTAALYRTVIIPLPPLSFPTRARRGVRTKTPKRQR